MAPQLCRQSLRTSSRAARDALTPTNEPHRLAAHALAWLGSARSLIIAGYLPIGSEIDPRPLLHALAAAGARLALPQTLAPGTPLVFRAWHPGAPLTPGRFGTLQPTGESVQPDLLLVPLLAFDPACHRLGYGGGYYDRTLAALPNARTLGCAYAAQRVPHIPTLPTDIALHAIATENGIMLPSPPSPPE